MSLLALTAVPLLTALAPQASTTEAPSDLLTLMDVFELEYVSDPQIAPAGDRVVFVRRSMDVMRDRQTSKLWIADVDGGDVRPLTEGEVSESTPRWSPDGERLAFVSTEAGSTQVHLRWMDTGQRARLTQLTESPGSLTWSPDGRWLAFTMLVPSSPKPLATLPSAPEGAEWADPPRVIESVQYRADGAGYIEQGRTHVFVLPVEGGTPRQLTHDDHDYGGSLSWTPDSKRLLLSTNRDDDAEFQPVESDVWELTIADGSLRVLTNRKGPDRSPTVSPDGTLVAYLGFDDRRRGYEVMRLHVMSSDGSDARSLTDTFDRSVESPVWAADGSGLFVSYDDHGNSYIAFVGLDGSIEVLAENVGGLSVGRPYTGGAFSVANNGRFAFTLGSTSHPADLAVGNRRGRGENAPQRLTRLNDDLFAFRTPGEVEEIRTASSFDGREVQGWIIKPPHFDPAQTYPLILEIHGGPFAAYGPWFSMEGQLYAAAGYVVLYTNPRGSTSYGDEFASEIHHNYPGQDYDDLMSSVDAVIERGYVDPERLYVTGGSGGGVLTAWIVGKTERFRAAVVAKPVINWISFVLTADAYPYFTRHWFTGYPWDQFDEYWKRSPLSLVGNVTTPTMLLTGEVDYRTPISESEQFYQALKLRRIDAALVRIPGASHGITARPSQLIAKVANILAWFERYAPAE